MQTGFRCWAVGFVCLCKINCVKRCSPRDSHSLSFPWLPALVSVGDGPAPPSLCPAFLLYEWSRFTSPSQGQCGSAWVYVCVCVCVFSTWGVCMLEIELKCVTVAWHDKFRQYSIELQYVSVVMTTAAWERIPTELLRRYWNYTVIGHIHDDALDLAPISSPLAVWNNGVVTVRRLFRRSHTKNSCSLTYSSNKQPTLDWLIYRGSIPLICIHS